MTLLAFVAAAAAARRHHLGVTSSKNRTALLGACASSRKDEETNVREKRAEQKRRLQRFYVDASTFASPIFSLSKEESRHALKSLRLNIDDVIECCDGNGRLKIARLIEVDSRKTEATFEGVDEEERVVAFPGRMKWDVVVACAGIKGGRSDWLVEKLTELNGRKLVPLLTSRSGKIGSASSGSGVGTGGKRSKRRNDQEDEEETGKELRWQRVALAASKQSLRAHVFCIEKPVSFNDFVSSKYFSEATCRFVAAAGGADFAEKLRGVKERMDNSNSEDNEQYGIIIVGPEGDFDDEEMQTLMDTCETISLGDLRLRTETAAISSLSVAQMIINV